MNRKINKFKELLSSKKKKIKEVTTGKLGVSNGSLLSQNGEIQNKIGGGEYYLVGHMIMVISLNQAV